MASVGELLTGIEEEIILAEDAENIENSNLLIKIVLKIFEVLCLIIILILLSLVIIKITSILNIIDIPIPTENPVISTTLRTTTHDPCPDC